MKIDTSGVSWDLSSFFYAFDDPDMRSFKKTLQRDVAALVANARSLRPLSKQSASHWETLILQGEDLEVRLGHLGAYLDCLTAADSLNEAYSRQRAAFSMLEAEYKHYLISLQHAFNSVPDNRFHQFTFRSKLKEIAHYLDRIRQLGKYMMHPHAEALSSDLNVDGPEAWERLYERISGSLFFTMTFPNGKKQLLPISRWRGLMASPDRRVGQKAFEGGNRAWSKVESICAAALNAISGTRLTLNRHRKISHFLEPALFQAGIRKETLDAMYDAVFAAIDIPRNIYRSKAGFFGRTGIWFFEREAPLPIKRTNLFSWKEAVSMVGDAFEGRYPAFGKYFRGMLQHRWISSIPEKNRRPGAFCTGSGLIREQRVFMTFTGTQGDLSTLAHEAGHAWHSHLLEMARPLARHYPMPLAETASSFGEQLLSGTLLEKATGDGARLLMLDDELSDAALLLLDISTRFDFESKLYEHRREGELTVSELKHLMTESQRHIFADALLERGEDPLFWASKLHFYLTGVPFYNFPYTFGFLLARFLTNKFRKQGRPFLRKYEAFLKNSGSAPVETVLQDAFGVDVSRPDFWIGAIQTLETPLTEYNTLARHFGDGKKTISHAKAQKSKSE